MIRCECKSREGCSTDCDAPINNYCIAISEARQLPPSSRSRVLDFIIDRAHGLNKMKNAEEKKELFEESNSYRYTDEFNASDARELSLRNENKQELEEILKEIREVASEGEESLYIKRKLLDRTIRDLRDKNFKVMIQTDFYSAYEGICYTIRW